MRGIELWFRDSLDVRFTVAGDDTPLYSCAWITGGLFLDPFLPASFMSSVLPPRTISFRGELPVPGLFRERTDGTRGFLSVSLSVKGAVGFVQESGDFLEKNTEKRSVKEMEEARKVEGEIVTVEKNRVKIRGAGAGAINTSKHLWAGAFAAMVSRTFVAPLERLKLEYMVRGEQSNLLVVVRKIATTHGLKGFWRGNFVNVLRTAPFKAVHFYAYDTYRKQLLKFSGNEETTNFERFIAGAAAGITATILCIPMDTVRTKMVAPGGEALGGVLATFRHLVQTEGFFSLYKGLVPSIISMAPSGAVFYGVYDILKSAYLHSPEGRKRIAFKNQQRETNALYQLELGPLRTLLYGAIAGCCAEAATYPFEVVRRQLQMQVQATRLSSLATLLKIVEQGGTSALYAGLIPSMLQNMLGRGAIQELRDRGFKAPIRGWGRVSEVLGARAVVGSGGAHACARPSQVFSYGSWEPLTRKSSSDLWPHFRTQ